MNVEMNAVSLKSQLLVISQNCLETLEICLKMTVPF